MTGRPAGDNNECITSHSRRTPPLYNTVRNTVANGPLATIQKQQGTAGDPTDNHARCHCSGHMPRSWSDSNPLPHRGLKTGGTVVPTKCK